MAGSKHRNHFARNKGIPEMHKINAAEKLTRVACEKYDSCREDRQLRREILSLHHTTDLARSKAKELKKVILEGEQENLSPRGKQWVADEGAPSQLGKTIWNDIIGVDNLEIPSTSFMKKVVQAAKKNDYKQLMKKILDSLQEKRDQFCEGIYSTLKEARNKLYTMMTEIIV